jgi:hypothetical protein
VVPGIQRRVDCRRSGRGRDAAFLPIAEASANQCGRDNRWKYNSCSHRIAFTSFEKGCKKKVRCGNIFLPLSLFAGAWVKDILFTPDGRFAYIANFSNGEVDVIHTSKYQVTSIPTEGGSRRLCISPAG